MLMHNKEAIMRNRLLSLNFLLLLLIQNVFASTTPNTPVAINGQLTVCGTQLCNAQGNPIQLKGMSTHGL